jgi:hypothetical protein
VAVGEEPDTIEEVYEPFLIQEGYIKRTPQGRVPTEHAYERLGVKLSRGKVTISKSTHSREKKKTTTNQKQNTPHLKQSSKKGTKYKQKREIPPQRKEQKQRTPHNNSVLPQKKTAPKGKPRELKQRTSDQSEFGFQS